MKTNNLDQLRSEKEEAQRKRDQAQRQASRYANQIEYVQKRSRKERIDQQNYHYNSLPLFRP